MNIIVCIKQVPDTTDIKIDPETNTLIRSGVQCIINPFDMYAIEEGIRLKEKFGGRVTVMTMGPPQAEDALREAISLGADDAILVSDRAFAGSDTWATSYTLSRAVRKLDDYALVICGKQAIDGDTAQVGPGISAHIDIPQITYVKKIEEMRFEGAGNRYIRAERMTEEGYEIIESPLPCLITVVKEINEPRLPSLKGKMRAKKAEIKKWEAKDLELDPGLIGLNGSPTKVVKIFTPPPRKGGEILTGDAKDVSGKLVELLKNDIL